LHFILSLHATQHRGGGIRIRSGPAAQKLPALDALFMGLSEATKPCPEYLPARQGPGRA
jgi:hypothetical protein